MQWNKYIGAKGETLAIEWLTGKGFTVLKQNVKFGRNEIDIIALKDGLIHFIEVKTRTNDSYGFPEEKVGEQKIAFIAKAIEEYLEVHPEQKEVVIDVLAILLNAKAADTYFLVEDIQL